MRILYLADRMSVRGGADLHLRQVMEWALDSGHEVSLAVGRVEGGVGPPFGVSTRTIRGLGSATSSTSRLVGLDAALDESDLIHAQNIMNPVVLKRISETGRAVVTVQDHRVFCPAMGKTMPDGSRCATPFLDAPCRICLPDGAYRQASLELTRARRDALHGARLVVLSTYMKTELEAVGLECSAVIPPWVRCGAPRNTAGDGFLLGGRLVAHKAVLEALEAWRRAGEPSRLVVAGDGPLATSLHGVQHLGWLGQGELQAQLRDARAVLFPAFWQEPFGIMGVEALAQGVPVIVSMCGGTRDWSDRGCLRVEAGDVDAMADAIRWMSDHPDLALKMGEEGRSMVAERFGKDLLAPKLEAVYRSVGNRRKRA